MRLEVSYELADEEKRRETIAFFADLCRGTENATCPAQPKSNSLPVRYKQGVYAGLEPEMQITQLIEARRVNHKVAPKNQKGISLGKEMPFQLERSNWLPRTDVSGNEFDLERPIKPVYLALPDINTAPIGARIRFLRKRRGLTVFGLADATGVSHNAISNLERGAVPPKPWTLGPILSFFGAEAVGIFPGAADAFDAVVPPTDFGAWLNNFRLRNGLQLKDVAEKIGVSAVSIHYYEQGRRTPGPEVIKRLRRAFKLNGELDRFKRGRE